MDVVYSWVAIVTEIKDINTHTHTHTHTHTIYLEEKISHLERLVPQLGGLTANP